MDFIKETIERLEEYNLLIISIENLKTEIKTLNDEKYLLKSQKLSFATGKGPDEPDDKMANNIQKRIEAHKRLRITENRIKQIDDALGCLTADEKKLLEILFINGGKNSIDYACEIYGVEKARIYQMRTKALRKCGRALLGYGIA